MALAEHLRRPVQPSSKPAGEADEGPGRLAGASLRHLRGQGPGPSPAGCPAPASHCPLPNPGSGPGPLLSLCFCLPPLTAQPGITPASTVPLEHSLLSPKTRLPPSPQPRMSSVVHPSPLVAPVPPAATLQAPPWAPPRGAVAAATSACPQTGAGSLSLGSDVTFWGRLSHPSRELLTSLSCHPRHP